AFGLVTFTVIGVTQAGRFFLPGFDWRIGLVLGAVVAPTDAIAATAIARRVGLPKRVVDILEGESLLNDASALLALEFGLALLIGGQTPTFVAGVARLAYLIVVGVFIGLVVGEIVHLIEDHIDDGPIEIALSILSPYVAYLAADSVRASGVLAVVACGLYLSRKSSHFFSANVRLQAWAVWGSLTFILNGLVFVLIGLQLPYVLGEIRNHRLGALIAYGAIFSALLILLRLIWTFPGAHLANFIRRRVFHQNERMPGVRQIFVVGWTGMRGVISLAAAIALPQTLANGSPFAQRNMIIFLAFSVIPGAAVLAGPHVPPTDRGAGLGGHGGSAAGEKGGGGRDLGSGVGVLEKAKSGGRADSAEVYADLVQHYQHRLEVLGR